MLAEGRILAYIWAKYPEGRPKFDAIVVDFEGRRIDVTGFTDSEREMTFRPLGKEGQPCEPEKDKGLAATYHWHSLKFPRQTKLKYSYEETGAHGRPINAKYHREAQMDV